MAKRVSGRAPSGQALAVPAEPKVSALPGFDPSRLTVENFAAWAKDMPAAGQYNFFNNHGCALFLFLRDSGAPVAGVGGFTWRDHSQKRHLIPDPIREAVASDPNTYGALADRLSQVSS